MTVGSRLEDKRKRPMLMLKLGVSGAKRSKVQEAPSPSVKDEHLDFFAGGFKLGRSWWPVAEPWCHHGKDVKHEKEQRSWSLQSNDKQGKHCWPRSWKPFFWFQRCRGCHGTVPPFSSGPYRKGHLRFSSRTPFDKSITQTDLTNKDA